MPLGLLGPDHAAMRRASMAMIARSRKRAMAFGLVETGLISMALRPSTQPKKFAGGQLVLTGANFASGRRSMPARFVFLDEVDTYKGDVDGEGDPVALAIVRTRTFGHRCPKCFWSRRPRQRSAPVLRAVPIRIIGAPRSIVPCQRGIRRA